MTQSNQPNDSGAQQPAEALRATAKQLYQKAEEVLAVVTPQAASAAAAAQDRFGKEFARLQQSALLGKVLRPMEVFADWIAGIVRIRWMLATVSPAQTRPAEFKLFLLFFGALALCALPLFIFIIVALSDGVLSMFSDVLTTVFATFILVTAALSFLLLVSGMRAIPNRQVPRYMSFSGRACLQEFFTVCIFFVIMVLVFFFAFIGAGGEKFLETSINSLAISGIGILLLLPVFAACARRLHDIGRSGWIQLPLHVAQVMAPILAVRAISSKDAINCGNNVDCEVLVAFGKVLEGVNELGAALFWSAACFVVIIFLFYGREGQDGRNRFGDVAPRLRDIKPFQEQAPEQHAAAAGDGIAQSAAATPTSAADAVDDTPPRSE